MGNRNSDQAAYTIVELMVVVVLIVFLVTSVVWADSALTNVTRQSRDSERSDDMQSVALLFERYYRTSPTAAGSSYPTTLQAAEASIGTIVTNAELLTPPSLSEPVFSVASDTTVPQDTTVDRYVYQPFTANDTLCNLIPPCVRFILYYRSEVTDEIKMIESSHQQ